MSRFIGGPYDGEDLPVDASVLPKLRLPAKYQLETFLADPRLTTSQKWPHHYEADTSVDPPVYRFVRSD